MDLRAHEIADNLVGRAVDADVCEGRTDLQQFTLAPGLFEHRESFLARDRECRDGCHLHRHPGRRHPRFVLVGDAVGLQARDTVGGLRTVEGRHREVRRALEDDELLRLRGDVGHRLDGRRSGTDDGDALPREVDAFVGPATRHVDVALETIRARDVGVFGYGETTGGHHVVTAGDGLARRGVDRPLLCRVVPCGFVDTNLKVDTRIKIVFLRHVLRVSKDFGLRRVLFRPLPFIEQFRVPRVLVVRSRDVAARTRVAVPVPGATHVVAGFEHPRGEPVLAQLVQQVHAGEPRPGDNDVDVFLSHVASPWSAPRPSSSLRR